MPKQPQNKLIVTHQDDGERISILPEGPVAHSVIVYSDLPVTNLHPQDVSGTHAFLQGKLNQRIGLKPKKKGAR